LNAQLGTWSRLVALLLVCGAAQAAPPVELRPFTASYSLNWNGVAAGTAEVQLQHLTDGSWSYQTRIRPSFLARPFMPSDLAELTVSLFSNQNGRVLPRQFTADDGSRRGDHDQQLDFDWTRSRVTGIFERKPVDLPLQPGMLDSQSVQVALMSELIAGRVPQKFVLVEKGRIREHSYTREGEATLRTVIGEQRTVIFRSSRAGTDKSNWFWCAPELGYLPLKVERRDGKDPQLVMTLKTLAFEPQP
jgi:hypothetical protein